MPFTEPGSDDRQILLDIARQSIKHGLQKGTPLTVDSTQYSDTLQTNAATFVTLHIHGELRGCIGTLEAYQPMIIDVAQHAFDAAFKDPRFPPLGENEEPLLDIHISILTPAEPMQFSSQQDLIRQLKPGEDGLILEVDHHRGTFLPAVWESLPEPADFLRHLKLKAGLSSNYWSDDVKVSRYRAVSIP